VGGGARLATRRRRLLVGPAHPAVLIGGVAIDGFARTSRPIGPSELTRGQALELQPHHVVQPVRQLWILSIGLVHSILEALD
jgi:hypothetical protein